MINGDNTGIRPTPPFTAGYRTDAPSMGLLVPTKQSRLGDVCSLAQRLQPWAVIDNLASLAKDCG